MGGSTDSQIRFFAWKLCSRSLALKDGLIAKSMVLSPVCEVCGQELENLKHVFVDCCLGKDLWLLFPDVLPGMIPPQVMGDCSLWLDFLFKNLSSDKLRIFMVICSWLWKNRNKRFKIFTQV
ncbi:hypothetical protein ACFE04_013554 [Oxalis oulophora]